MNGLVSYIEKKRLIRLLRDKINGLVGKNVGDIALGIDARIVLIKRRVMGFSLPFYRHPVVITRSRRRAVAHVPFADMAVL